MYSTSKCLRNPLLFAALTVAAHTAHAGAVQTGSTLEVQGILGLDIMKGTVDAQGTVVMYGIPGVADGTAYSGVRRIDFITRTGDALLELKIESADFAVGVNAATGSVTLKVEMETPVGVSNAAALFDIVTGTGADTTEIKFKSNAMALDLGLNLFTSTGADATKFELEQVSPGRVNLNLSGSTSTSDDIVEISAKAKGSTVAVNGDLTSDVIKIEIEGDVEGDIALTGEAFDNVVEYLIKGTLNGSPQLFGGFFNDSVKLLAEGGVTGGSPMIDGARGTDSCSGSTGVNVVNCE